MIQCKKRYSWGFLILLLAIMLMHSVFAISNYDQTVYKVGSTYKEDCCSQKDYPKYTSYYSNNYYYHYQLQTKSSYEKKYTQKNYIEKSYVKTKKGFLGTYVKEYTVEIKNTGRTGEYFIVTFNLEDKNGFERKESVTNYIKTRETEKFVYRDVQFEKNEILHWDYIIDGLD